MISRLLAGLAGPRVLLGVALVSLAAIVSLGFMLRSAWQAEASAQRDTAELREQLSTAEQEKAQQRAQMERLQSLLMERDEAYRRARQRAESFNHALAQLRKTHENVRSWTDARVPDSVLEWLRQGSTDNKSEDGLPGAAGAAITTPSDP